ncbi:hypothetical protein J5491_02795 [Candidatus Saccharibacteria bacterium]|nr:hypothetical protein [Candidatus Saccharibacteria bacterium]MBO4813052.1 hypothetical protein [Candidatus Saccharibacteria bacterium]
MDQNQTVDNDLQKAIDNITNTTNADPVFSDPVAAPSSIPEGDTGELAEPVGPFPAPEPEPKVEMVMPAPEPIAPLEPLTLPDLNMPEAPAPEMPAPAPEPIAPIPPMPQTAPAPMPAPEPMPQPAAPAYEPAFAPAPKFNMPAGNLNMHQVKEAALRDLVPLLDHLNMNPSQKFNIYRNIFEDLRDYTILEPAYRAATEIPNDQERAEALLYLVESIDKM